MADALHRVTCVVNGRRIAFDAHPMERLLDVLRRDARLTGTKAVLARGDCDHPGKHPDEGHEVRGGRNVGPPGKRRE